MLGPSHLFVISDWGAAELVALAQVQLDLFGRSALADMLRAGRDPHAEFACKILGIGIESFDKSLPLHETARRGAKAFNFGKPGAMGQRRFIDHARDVYKFEMTPDLERRLHYEWLSTFPESEMFFDYVRGLECPDGTYTVIQPRSGRIRGGMRFPEACNTHFQGLAADAAKTALWKLWLAGHDPESALFTDEPPVSPAGRVPVTGQVLFVHDENVGQFPVGSSAYPCPRCRGAGVLPTGKPCSDCFGLGTRYPQVEAALHEQERIMVEAFAQWCPDVPIKVESTITERYTK